jgi:5'(3')-deoxyribonucleotidase
MKKSTFYLDMDGVVANWTEGMHDIIGRRVDDPNARLTDSEWQLVLDNPRVFRTLPKMLDADVLVDMSRKYRDLLGWDLLFLTAIPHDNDMYWAFYDKVEWAREFYPDIPVHFGPYSRDKHLHCRPGDILVDDRPDNCSNWINSGGTAFMVQGPILSVFDQIRSDFDERVRLKSLRDLTLII